MLERKQGLGQFVPIVSARDNGQDHGPVHREQGRRLPFSPEWTGAQKAQLPCTGAAERRIFGTTAHTFHRGQNGQQLDEGLANALREPRQPGRMDSPMARAANREDGEVRVTHSATAFSTHAPSIRLLAYGQHSRSALCGKPRFAEGA
ncbi:hypothetical protein GCM10017710_11970 [Arthrobacter ramosus]